MKKQILIIGGAGFIGSNSAKYFSDRGWRVVVFDNLSRKPGSKFNTQWLKEVVPKVKIVKGDIRYDLKKLRSLVSSSDAVLHLAAQVAVTTSVLDPRDDFEINALGTFNVLEAVRLSKNKPIILYSSTNKVYGEFESVGVVKTKNGYRYKNFPNGINEERSLDFHSPYGCSKGAADQYVRDYSRIYGLKTIVFRQSCIYGPRQFGSEDQGWVAWFIISGTLDRMINIYGDGYQIRDVLYIDDLNRAYELAIKHIDKSAGQVYNVGGGSKNILSLLKTIDLVGKLSGKKIRYSFGGWRPGDQKIFVSDITKAKRDFGWGPEVGVEKGVESLYKWINENKEKFRKK